MDLSAIRIKVTADTNEANNNLKKLESTGKSLSKVGAGLTLGLTVPILGAGTAALMTASDVGEMESKFNTVFKTTSKSVEKWADTYSDAIGRSKYELMEAVSNQADLMIGMGMTEKVAGDLSQKYTTLAYDLASFNNVNDKTAVEAMTKAMMGETEMAKQLGVNLSETIMANSEYVKSTGKSWKEMTMAEKAQARYHEAMNQSVNAIGDAERTQASFTNQLKRTKGNLTEISVEIGNVLLPVAEKITTKFNEFLGKILDLTKENPKLVEGIVMLGGALAALGPGMWIVGKLMTIFAGGGAAVTGLMVVAAAAGILSVAFIGLNENASQALLELPSKAQSAIARFLQSIVEALPEVLNKGIEIMFKLIEGIATGVPILLQFASDSMLSLCGLIFNFGPKFLTIGIDFIKNMLDGAIQKFPEFLGKMMDGILNVLANIRAELPEFLQNGIEFIGEMIKGITQNMPKIIAKIGELLAKLIGKIVEYLPKFLKEGFKIVGEIVKGLWNNKSALFNIGKDLMKGLWNSIKAVCKSFLNIGKSIVDNIKEGVANAWGSFTSWIGNKVSNIPVIGKIFKIAPNPDNEGDEPGNNPIPAMYGLAGGMARSPFMALTENFGGFEKSKQEGFRLLDKNLKDNKIVESKSIQLNINIDNFNNNREIDIEQLTDDIAFNLQRKLAF